MAACNNRRHPGRRIRPISGESLYSNVTATEQIINASIPARIFLNPNQHLIDPLQTLRRLKPFLSNDGVLIVSTPNAAYIRWRLTLLLGTLPDFGEDRSVLEEERPYNLLHKT